MRIDHPGDSVEIPEDALFEENTSSYQDHAIKRGGNGLETAGKWCSSVLMIILFLTVVLPLAVVVLTKLGMLEYLFIIMVLFATWKFIKNSKSI